MDTNVQLTYRKQQRGSILVLIAFAIVGLIAMAALVIDFGYFYSTRSQLQNTADSSALAGVALLVGTNSTAQTDARNEAIKFAAKNSAAGDAVVLDANTVNSDTGDIQVGNWNSELTPKFLVTRQPINAVKVIARRTSAKGNPVNSILGKIMNIANIDIGTQAIAVRLKNEHLFPFLLSVPVANGTYDFNGSIPIPPYLGVGWTLFSSDSSVNSKAIEALIETEGASIDTDPFCSVSCFQTSNGAELVRNAMYDKYMEIRDADGHMKILTPLVDMRYKKNALDDCLANNGHNAITDCGAYPDGCSTGEHKEYLLLHVARWTAATINGIDQKGKTLVDVTIDRKVLCKDNPNPLDVLTTYRIMLVE